MRLTLLSCQVAKLRVLATVSLTLAICGTSRSLTAEPLPSSVPVRRSITAICKQALAPYKRGIGRGRPGVGVSSEPMA